MNTFLDIHQQTDTAKRRFLLGNAKSLDIDFRINVRGVKQARKAKEIGLSKFIPRASVDFMKNILQHT